MDSCFIEYVRRAQLEWTNKKWVVYDLGILANRHTNACFWLSIIAGWSRLPLMEYQHSELNDLAAQVYTLRDTPLRDLVVEKRVAKSGEDQVGRLAHSLRTQVAGQNGFMLANQHWSLGGGAQTGNALQEVCPCPRA